MGLSSMVRKPKASTVMGIDTSTHSLAFAIYKDKHLVKYGKIYFVGNDSYTRLADAKHKMESLADLFNVDYIAVEKAIMVRSADTAIKLGMVVGVVIASVFKPGTKVAEIAPITWQSSIGNHNYNKQQKEGVRKLYPRKSASWRRNFIRAERKQFTLDYFNDTYDLSLEDDDVGDAMGLGWYTVHNLIR